MADHIIESVLFIARHGHRFLSDYLFDPASGMWRHKGGPIEPPLRLTDISYSSDGEMHYPIREDRAPESALKGYLNAAEVLASQKKVIAAPDEAELVELVGARFEGLRWFELPTESLKN